jgi:flagellar FliL protein
MAKKQTSDAGEAVEAPADGAAPPKGGRKKLIIIVAAAVLVLGGAGGAAYATGMLSKLTGGGKEAASAPSVAVPGGIDLPEVVANLNAGKRSAFVRIKARLELANKADEPAVTAAAPRIQDLFQTYLRDMRPEELRGSAGTYRLREELLARINIAVAPARATDILFVELLVQ